MRTKRYRG